MRRSKLETYIAVLQILARHGPLKLTHVMYKANLNSMVTKDYLSFLIQKGLVEERIVGRRSVKFTVTQSGLSVIKYFRELEKVLPIVEEVKRGSFSF